jgi:glyoxylase-like metal-dependent hydrolase (beta-lactamase superfamily II)
MLDRRTFQGYVGISAALGLTQSWAQDLQQSALQPKVGRFTSVPKAYSTHNFWIAGKDGVVMFDTQFLPSDAVKSFEQAQRETGLPVKTAIILHPNPDKFNGTAELQKRGVRVITSKQVAQLIPSVHNIRLGWFYKDYAPDYPKDAPQPEVFGSTSTTLDLHGLPVKLHVLGGAGCSAAHTCAQVGDALFVGDLLANNGHAWMELALFDAWNARLAELRALPGVKRIFVGRGQAAGIELIDQMAVYLAKVQQIVRSEKPSGDLSWIKRRLLKRQIENAFPNYEWDGFVWESLPEIWQKLQKTPV